MRNRRGDDNHKKNISFGQALLKIVGGLFKLLFKTIVLFGLWVPLLYALFGVILHFVFGFEPFDFSTFSTFYIVGGIVCIVIVVIISAYNVLINPIKRAFGKDRKSQKREKYPRVQPPLTTEETKQSMFGSRKEEERKNVVVEPDYSDIRSLSWLPPSDQAPREPDEKPDVYFSVLKPDILVHEYKDRFELYRVDGRKLVPIGTEYK